jgi:hypothetical protein
MAALGIQAALLQASPLFWLDSPGGRSNPRDPKCQSPQPRPQPEALPTPCTSDVFDPVDDSSAGANTLTPIAGALPCCLNGLTPQVSPTPALTATPAPLHKLSWSCDREDWYRFNLSQVGFTYTVLASGQAADHSTLTLYDATLAQIANSSGSGPLSVSCSSMAAVGVPNICYVKHSAASPGDSFYGSVQVSSDCPLCRTFQAPALTSTPVGDGN